MNRRLIYFGLGILAFSIAACAQDSQVFRGEVSDSQCALNIHSLTRSHQEMLKSKSMGGTSNTCAVYCIEHLGGYLVLKSHKSPPKISTQAATPTATPRKGSTRC